MIIDTQEPQACLVCNHTVNKIDTVRHKRSNNHWSQLTLHKKIKQQERQRKNAQNKTLDHDQN